MEPHFDLLIIGGGPAGCAAAVYASRKRIKSLLLAYEFGGQSTVSGDIQNWIGSPHISGDDLGKSLEAHVREYAGDVLEVVKGERATSIIKKENMFEVVTDSGKAFMARAVLIASGSGRRKLMVPGADKYEHKGITYCASCDGPLFSDQDVVVIGGGNAGFETAAQLLAYCKSVTLLHYKNEFKADEITVRKVLANPKMKGILNAELIEVYGGNFVEGLKYVNKSTGEIEDIKTSGIFVEVGQIPNTNFAESFIELNSLKKIPVDPMNQRTHVDGVWAAGDCTNGLFHQNNIAAGDAVKALEDIYLWLHTH
jgi:NADH-dependent peroxiredoxin subunit F